MKQEGTLKRILSVILSVVLVVSSITVTQPTQANAADPSANILTNGGFDNASEKWEDQDGTLVGEQAVVEDVTVHEIVTNGGFEDGTYRSGVNGWQTQTKTKATLSVIDDKDDASNKVLQVVGSEGGAQANFYLGEAGILEVGKTYTVSFMARQTEGGGGFHNYSDQVVGEWTSHGWKALSQDWTKIEYEIIPTLSKAWAQIGLQLDAACTVEIDNFSITYDAGTQVKKTYTEGIGTCNAVEPDNVLAMKDYTKVTQDVAIQKGNRYDYSFMVKSENAGEDLAFGVTAGDNTTDAVTVTSDWKEVTGSFTATADATEFGFTRGGKGTVLIDDVVLNETVTGPTDHTSMPGGGAYVPEGQYNVLSGAISDFSSDDEDYSLNGVGSIENGMLKITASGTNFSPSKAGKGYFFIISV